MKLKNILCAIAILTTIAPVSYAADTTTEAATCNTSEFRLQAQASQEAKASLAQFIVNCARNGKTLEFGQMEFARVQLINRFSDLRKRHEAQMSQISQLSKEDQKPVAKFLEQNLKIAQDQINLDLSAIRTGFFGM